MSSRADVLMRIVNFLEHKATCAKFELGYCSCGLECLRREFIAVEGIGEDPQTSRSDEVTGE